MYIGIKEGKHILRYVGFTRLCNFIIRFPGLYINISTNGIIFSLLYCARYSQWIKKVLIGLEKYVKQIDTSRYGDYIIYDHFLVNTVHFKEQVISE